MAVSKSSEAAQFTKTLGRLTLIRGVVGVLFGIFALIWPAQTVLIFVLLVSLWLLVGGVVNIISSILSVNKRKHWFLNLLLGVLQLGVGAYLVQRPGIAVATLVALIAIVLIVDGLVGIISSFMDGGGSGGEKSLSIIGGTLGLLAGIIIWRYPVQGGLAFVWVLGLYALVTGAFLIAAGVDVENSVKS